LLIGGFLLCQTEKLAIVRQGLLLVLEQIGVGIGDIIIGSNRGRVIGKVLLPRRNGLRIMLRQVVALALRERDGLHDGGIRLHQLFGEVEIAQSLWIALRVNTDHAQARW